jgi:peroxiredoxin (alkyl hydroperoxide reductase subunit C)
MTDMDTSVTGPLLGEKAPFFEAIVGKSTIHLKDFQGKWLIIITHPTDLLPVFKTRTIKYLLCKRRIKVLAVGNGQTASFIADRNFVKRYIMKHSLLVINDHDRQIARRYGLSEAEQNSTESTKGVFVIDPKGILRINLFFPLSKDRNFYEILKLVDSLQAASKQKKKQARVSRTCRSKIILDPGALSEEG